MKTGIDALSFDIAKLHFTYKLLLNFAIILTQKLENGLGLLKMTLPDLHQDAVVFGPMP
jgi:hydroxymethylglutaryl-CoA synthase